MFIPYEPADAFLRNYFSHKCIDGIGLGPIIYTPDGFVLTEPL